MNQSEVWLKSDFSGRLVRWSSITSIGVESMGKIHHIVAAFGNEDSICSGDYASDEEAEEAFAELLRRVDQALIREATEKIEQLERAFQKRLHILNFPEPRKNSDD